MARIRTIKSDFFTSEDITALTPLARLLYIAIWCEADKEGRLSWKPRTFKLRYLPADNCDIDALCAEIIDGGLVVCYGNGLAHIPGFHKHQHVNPRESASDLPEPPGWTEPPARKVGKLLREAVFTRDGNACVRCGSPEDLQADHILPQSCGGPHTLENLRTLCGSCNAARPVSGKGLDEDLAKDGLTLASLLRKYGIDASIPRKHAQGGKEGKGREGKDKETRQDASVAELLAGVDSVVVADFTAHRQAKRAPITATAIKGIQREASKAGMTLEAALAMVCERGWQGFKAEWVNKPGESAGAAKPGGGRTLLVGGKPA